MKSAVNTAEQIHNVQECWHERDLWTKIWQGMAMACLVVNVVAIAIEGDYAILSGIVAIFIAPLVIYQQFQLQDTDST
jgi:hypothetical protein